MAVLQFPADPGGSDPLTYSANGITYDWTGSYWKARVDNVGVEQIIAGANVTISPTSGTGEVTINSTGGGGGGGAEVHVGNNPPGVPTVGDLWFNSDDGRLYVYYTDPDGDSFWVDASPAAENGGDGSGGSVGTLQEVTDAGNETTNYIRVGDFDSTSTTNSGSVVDLGTLWAQRPYNSTYGCLNIWGGDTETAIIYSDGGASFGEGNIILKADGSAEFLTSVNVSGITPFYKLTDTAADGALAASGLQYIFSDGEGARIQATRATGSANTNAFLSFRTGGGSNEFERVRVTNDSLYIGIPDASDGLNSATERNITLNADGSARFGGLITAEGDGATQDGRLKLNCSQNSHGVTIQSPPHSANASYTLVLPDDTGSTGEFLTTDGSGNLSWTAQSVAATPNLQAVTDVGNTTTNPIIIGDTVANGIGVDLYEIGIVQVRNDTDAQNAFVLYNGGNGADDAKFAINALGGVEIGGDPIGGVGEGNITLSPDGAATFRPTSDARGIEIKQGRDNMHPQIAFAQSNGLPAFGEFNAYYYSFGIGGANAKDDAFVIQNNGNIGIGGPPETTANISLNADGSALYKGTIISSVTDDVAGAFENTSATETALFLKNTGGGAVLRAKGNVSTGKSDTKFIIENDGTTLIGGDLDSNSPTITLNADGSGIFNGQLGTNTTDSLNALFVNSSTGGAHTSFAVRGDGLLTIDDTDATGSSPNISLDAMGIAKFSSFLTTNDYLDDGEGVYAGDKKVIVRNDSGATSAFAVYEGGLQPEDRSYYVYGNGSGWYKGTVEVGGTSGSGNISLNADGSAQFINDADGLAVRRNDTDGQGVQIKSNSTSNSITNAWVNSAPKDLQFWTKDTTNVTETLLGFWSHTGGLFVGPDSLSPNIALNADGTASFAGTVNSSENTIVTGTAPDFTQGNFWVCAGGFTIFSPDTVSNHASGLIRLTAAPTGWGANYKFPNGVAPTISTFPAIVPYYVQDINNILCGSPVEGVA